MFKKVILPSILLVIFIFLLPSLPVRLRTKTNYIHKTLPGKIIVLDTETKRPINDVIAHIEWVKGVDIIHPTFRTIAQESILSDKHGQGNFSGQISYHYFDYFDSITFDLSHPRYKNEGIILRKGKLISDNKNDAFTSLDSKIQIVVHMRSLENYYAPFSCNLDNPNIKNIHGVCTPKDPDFTNDWNDIEDYFNHIIKFPNANIELNKFDIKSDFLNIFERVYSNSNKKPAYLSHLNEK